MLDLVMMTHGWRRIKWDALVRGQLPVIKNPEQDFLAMKVDVLGVDPYKIAKDESLNVILSRKDSSTQMLSVPHISGSKFGVMGLVFFDTVRHFICSIRTSAGRSGGCHLQQWAGERVEVPPGRCSTDSTGGRRRIRSI
jgi:hypothetical protein